MTLIKMPHISHTNPKEINMDKIQIGPKGLIKYSHPTYGKSHFLVLRLPVCQLDKYPIEYFLSSKMEDKKSFVNLKIPIGKDFIKSPFYVFLQNILNKYADKDKSKARYPMFDPQKEVNYLKIKDMDSYLYSITSIDNNDFKIKTTNRKVSSLSELYNTFNSNIQVVPYVMLYYHNMPNGQFITLKPVRFYIGNKINIEQIDYIQNKQRNVNIPMYDFYYFNKNRRCVSLTEFTNYLKSKDNENKSITDTKLI
jgi:hypothetical protein